MISHSKPLLPALIVLALALGSQGVEAQAPEQTLSVDSSYQVTLGGVEQYIELWGASRELPVLLYLHGGPCMPATPLLRFYQAELSRSFIVVSWDQRGCGRSAESDPRPPDMTLERHVEDAHQLTVYLKETLGKDKIFLVGHSWGSVLGVELAQRYPEDYLAYVGVGQVVDIAEGELLALGELLARALSRGDTATVRAVESNRYSPGEGYADGLQGFLAHRRLLWMYRMFDYDPSAMLRAIAAAEGYSTDIAEWMTAATYAQAALYGELMAVDFTERTEFQVPVFFFAGRHDYNTPGELAARYLEAIDAPAKRFVWFEGSGHSPPWEEPDIFRARLVEVLDQVQGSGPGYRILDPEAPVRIPFDVHRGDIRMVGEVNGRPVRMLIDNGILWDDLLFFGSPLVDSLGFSFEGDVAVRGSGEGPALESRTTSGVTLRFPGVEFLDQKAVVTPYTPGAPNLWEGSEGQISAALFKNFVVGIDFDEMVITLTEPEAFRYEWAGVELPMTEMPSGMWGIPATLELPGRDPVVVQLALDLGNSNPLQISVGGAHGFVYPDESIAASLGFGMQGEVLGRFGPVRKLTLGGITVENVLTAFDEGNEFEEAMVGFELLSRFNLTFDYPHKRLILQPNSHFADPFELYLGGAYLRSVSGGGVQVARVVSRSPAAEAGLQEGDRILEVGGADVSGHDLFQLGAVIDAQRETAAFMVERDGFKLSFQVPVGRARFIVNSDKFDDGSRN